MAGLGLFLCCCDDCPTCPKEPGPPPFGHYRLYAISGWNPNGLLMSIDVPADTIVDSVRVTHNADFICVTPDGENLLVRGPDGIYRYSTRDLSYLGWLDRFGYYYFDGGDGYGIFTDGSFIHFIDPATLLPTDSLNIGVDLGYLDTVANQFFAGARTGATIYQVDCNTRTLVDSFVPPFAGGVTALAYNRLTDELYYLIFVSSYYSYFVQYDCDGDSVISKTYVTHATGDVAVSPDCKRVYMTDGGNGMLFVVPPGNIWVFDGITDKVVDWIAPFSAETRKWLEPYFGEFLITPDNRRAYVGAARSSGGPLTLPVVDLERNIIIKTLVPDSLLWRNGVGLVALGPIPK
jgi:hypothetical protein